MSDYSSSQGWESRQLRDNRQPEDGQQRPPCTGITTRLPSVAIMVFPPVIIRGGPCPSSGDIAQQMKQLSKKILNDDDRNVDNDNRKVPQKKTSMRTLITWNVRKALAINPNINLKIAIEEVQNRLAQLPPHAHATLPWLPEEQHLACAVLAWHELGHTSSDSLYSFIEFSQNETRREVKRLLQDSVNEVQTNITGGLQNTGTETKRHVEKAVQDNETSVGSTLCSDSKIFSQKDSFSKMWKNRPNLAPWPQVGPVLRLPAVEPKVIMRVDNHPAPCHPRKTQKQEKMKKKIACCSDLTCAETLASMDKETVELRQRAERLAWREAERAELLERAETAWRGLEAGYQRRLRAVQEKEHEMDTQITKAIHERYQYKNACKTLAENLKAMTEVAEKDRVTLNDIESEVCCRACDRVKLGEQVARSDAELAQLMYKAAQLDRDLMFKEEQIRRRQQALESDVDAAQGLTHETERVVRAELSALKGQVQVVAQELLAEDAETERLKRQVFDLRDEKNGMVEDLDGCQLVCDGRMKATLDELKKKKEELLRLKQQDLECRCKVPVDEAVEARRTPSLAALCQCTPEQKLVESCSCTSLRSRLLNDLMSDLFGGLQSEMGDTCTQMPCQLLKCLEDKHNWDRMSIVKTNLRSYFSRLLRGELDIAIATSIENYHAKWVGESCADEVREDFVENDGWQARALELKAQKLATKLAEQLFQEKAKELAQQAKNVLEKTGRPPCECNPTKAVYQCLVKSPNLGRHPELPKNTSSTPSKYLRQTIEDVTQLRKQIEDLKKDSIKREDLKIMESKIAKMVRFVPITSPIHSVTSITEKSVKGERQMTKLDSNVIKSRKPYDNKKKPAESNASYKKVNKSVVSQKGNLSGKFFKRPTQQFAVNMCLYESKKKESPLMQQSIETSKSSCMRSLSRDPVSQLSRMRQSRNILQMSSFDYSKNSTVPVQSCKENCICFHRKPSTTSIDKLLETLTKWKDDLGEIPERENINENYSINQTVFRIIKKNSAAPETRNSVRLEAKVTAESDMEKLKLENNQQSYNSKTDSPLVSDEVISTELPAVTESEYMGAINLDKSSESNENNEDSRFPIKCIKSPNSFCKSCDFTKICNERGNNVQSFIINKPIPIECKNVGENADLDHPIKKKCNERGDVTDDVQYINNTLNCSTMLRSYYENHIKCLGVTLTNVFPTKNKSMTFKGTQKQNDYFDSNNMANEDKFHFKCHELKPGNVAINVHSVTKLDRINTYNKSKTLPKDAVVNDSLNESCICCKPINIENCNDLEVNTFLLLEEHLKGKLEKFKHCFCKSSCIPDADEEKLFKGILQRIKQLISDSTNTVTCKCTRNNELCGSWNRAYSLLHEYLKTKIERVRCQCHIDDDIEDKSVLPTVLKNISQLIENDFQRLKEICKCNNMNHSPVKAESNIYSQDEVKPFILDINEHETKKVSSPPEQGCMTVFEQNKTDVSLEKIKCNKSEDLIFPLHNISAQVSPYEMETKSCNALELEYKYTESQTVNENEKILTIDGYNYARSGCDCCNNAEKPNQLYLPNIVVQTSNIPVIASPLPQTATEYFSKCDTFNTANKDNAILTDIKWLFDEQKIENLDVSDKKPSLQYIGYTMDCNCDNNLGCVCTKSTVRALNDRLKIEDIWKSFTSKNAIFHNVSYMLNSTSNKLPTNVNCNKVTKDLVANMISEAEFMNSVIKSSVCESEISATVEKDISLIKSKENVNMTHEMTNTTQTKLTRKSKTNSSVDCNTLDNNPSNRKLVGILKHNKFNDIHSSQELLNLDSSDTALNISSNTTDLALTCGCKLVPVCHVKMLVSSIEDKLANDQCTCDSFIPKVCPVHSQKLNFNK